MSHYFFEIHADGDVQIDDTSGTELATMEEVRAQAMRLLPAIAHNEIPHDGDRRTFVVLVTDEHGHPVYVATLNYTGLRLVQ